MEPRFTIENFEKLRKTIVLKYISMKNNWNNWNFFTKNYELRS